jgi:hypothetical protein
MAIFEFSRWDGSSEFTLQSADEIFDQFDQQVLDYSEQVTNRIAGNRQVLHHSPLHRQHASGDTMSATPHNHDG